MDNHAGNLLKCCSTNYLAGLIDSDFGVYIHKFFPRGKLQLRPTIQFVSANKDIIEVLHQVFKSVNINHHIAHRKGTVSRDKKELTISRLSKCRDFSELYKASCVVRRGQLELISKYCANRLFMVDNYGWKQNNTPYTKYQMTLYDELSFLNSNYNKDYGFRNRTLSWLAGFIDGDGSFCFVVTNKNRIIPTLDIITGSDTCLANLIEIFDAAGIKYYIRKSPSKATKRIKTNKIYNIYIRSFNSLFKISNLLKDKLIIKHQQCKNIIDYINLCNECRSITYTKSDIVCRNKILNTK